MRGIERRKKTYVFVTSDTDTDGKIIPRLIKLDNGAKYQVTHIFGAPMRASSKAGGTGIRYIIEVNDIQGKERFLFFEEHTGKWFVEEKIVEQQKEDYNYGNYKNPHSPDY